MTLRIAPETIGRRRFRKPEGFAPFQDRTFVRLMVSELSSAVPIYPLAFLPMGERLSLVALLGLVRERNLYIGKQGKWLSPYIPAQCRRHPFALEIDPDGSRHLSLEAPEANLTEESAEDSKNTTALYDDSGAPTAFLDRMQRFLDRLTDEQSATDRAATLLREAGVLEEWPIRVALAEGEEEVISCYLRVSESALTALSDAAFLRLRREGALPIAYAQLLSMRNIKTLAWMYRMREARTEGNLTGLPSLEGLAYSEITEDGVVGEGEGDSFDFGR
ncbi:MAG: SapC family protein [Pseudomonadota bacterium]